VEKMKEQKEDNKPADLTSGYTPKDIQTRVVKCFLDILILIEMKKQKENTLGGYDITGFINNRFGGILSPGTVYATLYAMERRGVIAGSSDGKKTVYALTEKGDQVVSMMMQTFHKDMAEFASNFLI
jgi:DNA-binding PadR family transcriptional regulator